MARRAEPTWFSRFSQAVRQLSWASIRANPGAAIATVAVTVWVAAAVSVSLLTFAGSHTAQAQVAPPRARTSSSSPAADHAGRVHDQGGGLHVGCREAVPDRQSAVGLRAASGSAIAVILAHAATLAISLG